MVPHFKQRAKRILYRLRKQTNRPLHEFAFGQGEHGQHAALEILRRLMKKKLVAKISRPWHDDLYYLTEEGRQIADEIVQEIDEYKSW